MSNVPKPPKPRPKPKRSAQPAPTRAAGSVPEGVRLQKLLAGAGIASRRRSEDLIRRGLVTVDGRTAVLGERVDPTKVAVAVEGRRVSLDPGKLY
ncbi:MAG: rRNA synthase, partial [Actinomycetota bacterium]|nr:rRNA synthase [Actinomycetota bacterium]